MVENTIARIIFEANQQKHYVLFADCLFEYISSHPELTSCEKLIWLNLIRKSHFDPNFRCALTHNQIASMVGMHPAGVYRGIRRLKALGFLQGSLEESRRCTFYTVALPKDGIAAIYNAPNRKKGIIEKGTHQKSVEPANTGEVPTNLPRGINKMIRGYQQNARGGTNKMPTLLINNINNKINKHNTAVEISNAPSVKNADALVYDFECLHKKYDDMTPVKRMQKILSHFSQEEMQLISSYIIARQKERETQGEANKTPPGASNEVLSGVNGVKLRIVPQTSANLQDFKFDNEIFLIEEAVKNKILTNIPLLYEQNKIKGSAGRKPLPALLKEIFYYVTKSGGGETKKISQLNRYYIAQKICLDGRWEKPKGIMQREILDRENQWEVEKKMENEASTKAIRALGVLDAL